VVFRAVSWIEITFQPSCISDQVLLNRSLRLDFRASAEDLAEELDDLTIVGFFLLATGKANSVRSGRL
jgi:hypothetical protein